MTSDLVLIEPGLVSTIRLNDPPLNLVSGELTRALDAALQTVEASEKVRAVVVASVGERAFSAGSNVREFASLRGRVGEGKLIGENAVYTRLAGLALPTVAALEGDALGGGLELALCCDLRVASETARLGLPEVGLGVIPGSGGTQRLPRLIGLARAKELILLGEIIDAQTAHDLGLVNRVVPAGEAEAAARRLAETLASRGPIAVREAKGVLDTSLAAPLEEGLSAELAASERIFSTADMLEGVEAFLEKRTPRFENR